MLRTYSVPSVIAAEKELMQEAPQELLMQIAATGLADACMQQLDRMQHPKVVALCGSGNNGGDTLWACAKLAHVGIDCTAICTGDKWHPEGASAFLDAGGNMLTVADTVDSDIAQLLLSANLILDGIVGIGFSGTLPGRIKQLLIAANTSQAIKIAVDLPSGLNGTSGAVEDPTGTFKADITVTMGAIKRGLLVAPGRRYAGKIQLVDIGLNKYLDNQDACCILEARDLANESLRPDILAHKYSRGVVGLLAGSPNYRGAAMLSAAGARCGGVGMVQFVSPHETIIQSVVQQFWDVVAVPDLTAAHFKANGIAIGPGLGTTAQDYTELRQALQLHMPVVVDADALALVAENRAECLQLLHTRFQKQLTTVLTPHMGEFQRLGFSVGSAGNEERLAAARQAASALKCIVVLKGPGTIVAAPDGLCFIDSFGSACLSTAGSGDILTGLIASMLSTHSVSRQPNMDDSARIVAAAVSTHALAGSLAQAAEGFPTAKTIAKMLPKAVHLLLHDYESASVHSVLCSIHRKSHTV